LNTPERAEIMNRHIFMGITGLLVLTAVCIFWGANQTIANTQTSATTLTSADIQTAITQAHKTGQQRRQDAEKALEDALNQGMGPVLITDELINEIIPMGTAPLATVPNATSTRLLKTTGIKTAAGPLATLAPPNPLYPT
jgi:hypothetical protein